MPGLLSEMRLLLPLSVLLALTGCPGDTGNGKDSVLTDDSSIKPEDNDGDGFDIESDCNDDDAAVNPDAEEVCDGVDNNCDGQDDEGMNSTWYADNDGDGFGDPNGAMEACEKPEGTVENDDDCDDDDRNVNPDERDMCNGVDDNCNDDIDEDADFTDWWPDADGDGHGDASESAVSSCDGNGLVDNNEDCDDADSAIHPGARDGCDEIDNDCDGDIDEQSEFIDWYEDGDGDGYGDASSSVTDCSQPSGYVEDTDDCNEAVAAINPGASETCNSIDDNCNGLVDDSPVDGQIWYADRDGDTYGDSTNTRTACDQPSGYVVNSRDCDDTDSTAYPGATEICDGADNDCDGQVDETGATGASTWYADADSDGFGNASSSITACTQPTGYVTNATDCDDSRSTVSPGSPEVCDSLDNDCDGQTDEGATDATTWYPDSDGDGYGSLGASQLSCSQPSGYVASSTDCNDSVAAIKPGATEVCDGVDNDCDGTTDVGAVGSTTYYADSDGDSYGNPSVSTTSCTRPAGYTTTNTDCNDRSATAYPGGTEICDLIDNDCDGQIDEGATDLAYLASDNDGDGFGEVGTYDFRCGGADNELDCDDADANEPVVVDSINGSSGGAGTLTSPYAYIQDGIAAANSCVVVYPGTYLEAVDFGGKNISVVSTAGAGSTEINSNGFLSATVTFDDGEGAGAVLAGFTLSGGDGFMESSSSSTGCGSGATCYTYYYTYYGGGIYVDASSPTIEDVQIVQNSLPAANTQTVGNDTYYYASYGGGVAVRNGGTLDAVGVSMLFNSADQGGAVYVDATSSLVLEQSKILANSATDGAGVNSLGSVTFTNVITGFNVATGDGGGLFMVNAAATLTNTVIAGNTGAGLYLSGTSSTGTVRNSIIASNSTYGVLVDSGSSYSGTYCDVYGNTTSNYSGTANVTGVNGNISADPKFVAYTDDGDLSNDDFNLQSSSPGVNTGNPTSTYYDTDGSRNNMGAYGGPGGAW